MEQNLKSPKQIHFEGGPRYTLIIPFDPIMKNPKSLVYMLKSAVDKAEKEIKERYCVEQALSLIKILREAINHVKCSVNEKTLAIFVSTTTQEIYYFTPTKMLQCPAVTFAKRL